MGFEGDRTENSYGGKWPADGGWAVAIACKCNALGCFLDPKQRAMQLVFPVCQVWQDTLEVHDLLFTHIKDAGIVLCHLQRDLVTLQMFGDEAEGGTMVCRLTTLMGIH